MGLRKFEVELDEDDFDAVQAALSLRASVREADGRAGVSGPARDGGVSDTAGLYLADVARDWVYFMGRGDDYGWGPPPYRLPPRTGGVSDGEDGE